MKKVLFISLVLLTGIPISCDVTGEGGSTFFRIESFAMKVGQFLDKVDPNSFSEIAFDPVPNDTLNYSDLAIEIRVDETSTIAAIEPFSFIPSAFADPVPPRAESKISLISIYANQSVFAGEPEYEAGSNLANLFLISSQYSNATTILKFLEDIEEWYLYENIYLTLNTPLDEPLAQTLLIDITLENGTVFNLESPKIVVK